jgi:hypothetical protein
LTAREAQDSEFKWNSSVDCNGCLGSNVRDHGLPLHISGRLCLGAGLYSLRDGAHAGLLPPENGSHCKQIYRTLGLDTLTVDDARSHLSEPVKHPSSALTRSRPLWPRHATISFPYAAQPYWSFALPVITPFRSWTRTTGLSTTRPDMPACLSQLLHLKFFSKRSSLTGLGWKSIFECLRAHCMDFW